jgi:hypothetical protein
MCSEYLNLLSFSVWYTTVFVSSLMNGLYYVLIVTDCIENLI